MSEEELSVPKGVVNKEEYEKYLKAKELFNKIRYYDGSDDKKYDLGKIESHIRRDVQHLPTPERETIHRQLKALQKLKGRLSNLKRSAYDKAHSGRYSSKGSILDSMKAELIEYFGRFFTEKEVHAIVRGEWGYDVSMTSLRNWRVRYIDEIKERQEEFKRDYSDMRLGYKRGRLEELDWLFGEAKKNYKATNNKDWFTKTQSVIEQIKKEIEGDLLTIQGDISLQIEHTISHHVNKQIMTDLSVTDIIVSRICGRLGLNPNFLMSKLHNSYYAKFSGFDLPDKDIMTDEVVYPSQMVYNFDEIKSKYEKTRDEDNKADKRLSIPIEDGKVVKKVKDSKQRLIDLIRQQKDQVNESQDRIDENSKKDKE